MIKFPSSASPIQAPPTKPDHQLAMTVRKREQMHLKGGEECLLFVILFIRTPDGTINLPSTEEY